MCVLDLAHLVWAIARQSTYYYFQRLKVGSSLITFQPSICGVSKRAQCSIDKTRFILVVLARRVVLACGSADLPDRAYAFYPPARMRVRSCECTFGIRRFHNGACS